MESDNHDSAATQHDSFFEAELHRLSARNEKLSSLYQGSSEKILAQKQSRVVFATTCMDERTATLEEALGLLPGEGFIYGSGGARLEVADFTRLYADELKSAAEKGAEAVVYLVTHDCSAGREFGCAAFKTDVDAQIEYFTALQKEYKKAYPEFKVHVLMHDTKLDRLSVIVADENDDGLAAVLESNQDQSTDRPENFAHAGFGIYIGDAYRAWVEDYNEYFRLAAGNPDLAGNIGIALAVMLHHSTVDLESRPIVLHIDYPDYGENVGKTSQAAANIDSQVKEALRTPEAVSLLETKRMRVVKTMTDMTTWIGKSAGEPEFQEA